MYVEKANYNEIFKPLKAKVIEIREEKKQAKLKVTLSATYLKTNINTQFYDKKIH